MQAETGIEVGRGVPVGLPQSQTGLAMAFTLMMSAQENGESLMAIDARRRSSKV